MFTRKSPFARSFQRGLLSIGSWLLASLLLTELGHAQECVDNDGDGWGWNGTNSCLITTAVLGEADVSASACVDNDGDGFGWNGTASCVVGAQASPSSGLSATADCIDTDGDGWGWNGTESCNAIVPVQNLTPVTQQPTAANNTFDLQRDLIALHFDHAPDRDDGHAAVAGLMVRNALQLNMQVVAGTYGVYNRDRYVPESEQLMSAVWGSAWHNAHSDRAGSVISAVNRWTSVLAAGGAVWVAEGGQSDFTAAVVRTINANNPEFNTRQSIHVIQHSDWNEDHSLAADLQYTQANTRYVKIADGNDPNATADFRFESHNNGTFVARAQSSQYANEWAVAFNYLSPSNKLDFSDTVELLHIIDIGISEINDVNDFGDYFF